MAIQGGRNYLPKLSSVSMKKKRKHSEIEAAPKAEEIFQPLPDPIIEPTTEPITGKPEYTEPNFIDTGRKFKKSKQGFTRVAVDPSKRYFQPESRESWGPNVKGKKFRKEKGKKKRCPNAGVRIDGSVKSFRLDSWVYYG